MIVHTYNYYVYLSDTNGYLLDNLKDAVKHICEDLSLNIVGEAFHDFGNASNTSISNSGVYLLSTSHFAWHTFPECGYIHINLSTCGPFVEPIVFENLIRTHFNYVTEIKNIPCVL